MASTLALANLGTTVTREPAGERLLRLLLRVEAWLDRRASSRSLYRLDERGLADLGLSQADVERINAATSSPLPPR